MTTDPKPNGPLVETGRTSALEAAQAMGINVDRRPVEDLDDTAFDELDRIAEQLAKEARSEATRKAYAADYRRWRAWCEQHPDQCDPGTIDIVTVRRFLVSEALAGKSMNTIKRRLGSLSALARRAGQPSLYLGTSQGAEVARLADTMTGMQRRERANPGIGYGQATALTLERLALVLDAMDGDDLKSIRDRGVLLVAFHGLLRPAEAGALWRYDVAAGDGHSGLDLTLSDETKTNKGGTPDVVAIGRHPEPRLCAVRSLELWLDADADCEPQPADPLFCRITRGGRLWLQDGRPQPLDSDAIGDIVRNRAAGARQLLLDAGEPADGYRGQSPRRGCATSLAQRGANEAQLEEAGRWAEGSPVPRRYIEAANRLNDRGVHLLHLPLPGVAGKNPDTPTDYSGES